MKNIEKLSKDLLIWSKRVEQKAIEKHREVAEKICKDVKNLAPGNGKYTESIKVGKTITNNGVTRTLIYTDLTSDNHAVGRMIEHGTGIYALEPHIGHTKTFFESDYRYWYVPEGSVDRAIGKLYIKRDENGKEIGRYYIAYAQKPKPHFLPALISNKRYYKQKIKEAFRS